MNAKQQPEKKLGKDKVLGRTYQAPDDNIIWTSTRMSKDRFTFAATVFQIICTDLGISGVTMRLVRVKDMPRGHLGRAAGGVMAIAVNSRSLVELVDTIAHELRHCFQIQAELLRHEPVLGQVDTSGLPTVNANAKKGTVTTEFRTYWMDKDITGMGINGPDEVDARQYAKHAREEAYDFILKQLDP